jgi:hypothetical protein
MVVAVRSQKPEHDPGGNVYREPIEGSDLAEGPREPFGANDHICHEAVSLNRCDTHGVLTGHQGLPEHTR